MNDSGFTPEQQAQLKTIFREALEDVGLRTDGPDHIEEARKDFMFMRSLRHGVNGTAAKIGWAIIAAIIGVVFFLINNGLHIWKAN